MNRTKNATKNIITGFFNKIIITIFPFIMRTVIIKKLGTEYLGLSSLFTSILQVLNLTELGFSNAIIFSLYKPIAEKNKEKICALMNFYKKTYRTIGFIILIIGLLLLPFLKNLINGTYPSNINIYLLYLIYLFNTVITYYLFAYKGALLTAMQKNNIINNINTIVISLQYIIQIIVLYLTKNYYLFILINTACSILNNLVVALICNKKYPQYICDGVLTKNEKINIKKRIYGLMIQKICGTTRNSLDSIFLSMFLGLNTVAIYSNYYSILSAIIGILAVFTTNLVASIGNSIVTESIDKNYNDMNKFNFIYMWVSGWCTICLLCLYQPFMELWMGNKYMFSNGIVICFCIYFYTLKMGDILSTYTQASGIWWEGRYKAIIETIFNIVLNFILGKLFGVYGIILATVISLMTVGFTYGTHIVFKNYFKEISKKDYYKRHFIYMSVTFVISIFTYSICNYIDFHGIINLIIKIIICIFVPNILYFIIYFKTRMFKDSFQFIKNIIKIRG